jgi:regulator of sirC expression with transglutaminase-like and TPR domain
MPGHFIARVGGPNGVYVDPFTGGRRLSVDECRQIVERLSDSNVTWSDDFLAPSTPDQILERVLQNLFGGSSRVGDTAGQYRTATFLSALRPDSAERLFQRAQSAEATGAFELARSLYNEVMERFPEASEAEQAGEALMKDNEEPTVN